MTDCNPQPLRFSSLGRKAVVADFRGGRLTTDAGALLLREVADRLGLFDALDAAIPDPRHPVLIVHDRGPCWPSGSSPSPWATRTSTTTRPSRRPRLHSPPPRPPRRK